MLISTSYGRTIIDIALDHKRIEVLKYLVGQKNISISESKGDKNNATYATLEVLLKTQMNQNLSTEFSVDTPVQAQRSPHRSPRTPKFKQNVVKINNLAQVSPTKESSFSFNTPPPKYRRQPPPLSHRPQALCRTRKLPGNSNSHRPINSRQMNDKTTRKDNTGHSTRRYLENGIPSYNIDVAASEQVRRDKSDLECDGQSFDDEESVATTIEDECIICCDQAIDCVFTPCGHQVSCLKCSKHLTNCPICCNKATVVRIFRP